MSGLLIQSFHGSLDEDPYGHQGPQTEEGSYDELNAPEYSTDEFRMFHFKVERCPKRCVHDWRLCPFAHPTENARRRDPRIVHYVPVPCPEYKRGICLRGDTCGYAHGVYECWLHPARYRTQLCKEGGACRRPVCFFAHSSSDLRQPTHQYPPPVNSLAVMTPISMAQPGGVQGTPVPAPARASATTAVASSRRQAPPPSPRAAEADGRAGPDAPEEAWGTDAGAIAAPARTNPVNAAARKAAAAAEAPSTPEPVRAHSCSSTASSAQQLTSLLSPRGSSAGGVAALGGEVGSAPRMSNAVARKLGLAPRRGGGRRGSGPFTASNGGAATFAQQHGFRLSSAPSKGFAPGQGPSVLGGMPGGVGPDGVGGTTIPAAYSDSGSFVGGMHAELLSFVGAAGAVGEASTTGVPFSEDSQNAGLETVGSVLAGLGGLGLDDDLPVDAGYQPNTHTPRATADCGRPCADTPSPAIATRGPRWTGADRPAYNGGVQGSGLMLSTSATAAGMSPIAGSWGPSAALASAFSTPRGGASSGTSLFAAAFPSSLDAFLPCDVRGVWEAGE